MSSNSKSNDNKCSDRQKELVEKLFSVHENLRRKHRWINQQCENDSEKAQKQWNEVWQSHKDDFSELKEYSEAMYELATQVWDPRNGILVQGEDEMQGSPTELKCRIEWVVSKCREHFPLMMPDRKLRLLDVGSCYNPFLKHGNLFDITAMDLCPAPGFEDTVYKCDFLEVPVSSILKTDLTTDSKKILTLPRNYFDVVVFSFFLEYLPDQKQRLDSCRKAVEVLNNGGILFVLRPDSNSMTESTVRLIKKLKVGLALVGFKRIYYEKLKHVWCTGYIKLAEDEYEEFKLSKRFQNDLNKFNFSYVYELFAIAQDFKQLNDKLGKEKIPDCVTNTYNDHDWDDLPFPDPELLCL